MMIHEKGMLQARSTYRPWWMRFKESEEEKDQGNNDDDDDVVCIKTLLVQCFSGTRNHSKRPSAAAESSSFPPIQLTHCPFQWLSSDRVIMLGTYSAVLRCWYGTYDELERYLFLTLSLAAFAASKRVRRRVELDWLDRYRNKKKRFERPAVSRRRRHFLCWNATAARIHLPGLRDIHQASRARFVCEALISRLMERHSSRLARIKCRVCL